jgi:hypothetical protein
VSVHLKVWPVVANKVLLVIREVRSIFFSC